MKISPEAFVEENKNKTYEALLSTRDELIAKIRKFEEEHEQEPEDVIVEPVPHGDYYCNLKLLGALCNLIAEKFEG